MNKGNFSRVFRWVILNVLFIVTNTQEVDVNKYLITKTNAERCQTFQERLRSLKNFESILNGFKANCEEEYYVFSQDIFENQIPIDIACTLKNSNKIMGRLEYMKNLINRIAEYCKTKANGITLTNTIIGVSTTKGTTEGTSRIPALETSTLLLTTSSTKTFLVGTLLINASPLSSNDVWSKCYFKTKVFDGELQITNFNVTVLYQTDILSDTVVRFQEIFISRDEEISAICKENASLKVYIGVAKDGKKIPVDTVNSGLKPSAELLINYTVMEDGRTVSAVMRMSDSGPFYNLLPGSFQNIFHFKLQRTDYSLKVLNPSMQEAILNNSPGNEVWYPPLNSFKPRYVQYRTCFIKIGTRNANNNLLIRVVSQNDDSTLLGIHEKGLTNGSACIEYRCSVRNPDFDLAKITGNDFYRYAKSYTLVKIIPVGQVCSVSSESSVLRHQEQMNIGLSSPRTNVGNAIFEANIPDYEYEGIYFHKSDSFDRISDARQSAIKECTIGVHDSFSRSEEDMTPNVGLASTFICL